MKEVVDKVRLVAVRSLTRKVVATAPINPIKLFFIE